MTKHIAILGSTGSIGTQTLDVARAHTDKLTVEVLTAGHNAKLLIEQAREFKPNAVVIADETKYTEVREALADLDIKVWTGSKAIEDVVQM
ncbi:MAG: 1-deoxy-D-xylulose-5-phosphate reductoisomerase, partial [Salinivirgaceae bacterium]|nr:1-deoxy-D-xylulose-5-phosphate reductoisomerase [Salinivirgaceae bacterium]